MNVRSLLMSCMLAVSATGCSANEPPSILRVQVEAIVDGQAVTAVRRWSVKVADAFPQGATIQVSGAAVVIPLRGEGKVYGLLRTSNEGIIEPVDRLVLALDHHLGLANRSQHKKILELNSFAKSHRYISSQLVGQSLEICAPLSNHDNDKQVCPLFVYLDSESAKTFRLVPNQEPVELASAKFFIKSVRVSYENPNAVYNDDSSIAQFRSGNPHEVVGTVIGKKSGQKYTILSKDFWKPYAKR